MNIYADDVLMCEFQKPIFNVSLTNKYILKDKPLRFEVTEAELWFLTLRLPFDATEPSFIPEHRRGEARLVPGEPQKRRRLRLFTFGSDFPPAVNPNHIKGLIGFAPTQ